MTDNLQRRISQHQNGENATTAPYRPFHFFHSEGFLTRPEARTREKYLKSGVGKEFLKQLLNSST